MSNWFPRYRALPSSNFVKGPSYRSDNTFVLLKYDEIVTLSETAINSRYAFRGNDVFDPNFTGTGRQPEGFDKYCAAGGLYTNFRVYGSKIKVTWVNQSSSIDVNVLVYPTNTTQTTDLQVSWPGFNSIPYAKWKFLGATVHGEGTIKEMTTYMSTYKMTGNPGWKFDDLYVGTYANAPSANGTWWWVLQAVPDASAVINVKAYVEITYYVKFFRGNELDDEAD